MSTPQIESACRIAVRAHAGQVDKNGEPYIKHPAMVAALARDLAEDLRADGQFTETAVAVSWLHDVIEDTTETAVSLRAAAIDDVVIEAVVLLTRSADVADLDYYAAITENPLARLVKTADIASNLAPERVARLDSQIRERLASKYEHALKSLGVDRDEVEELLRRRPDGSGADDKIRTVPIHADSGLYVDASAWVSGDLSLEGQDLRGADEYEYFLKVDAAYLPAVRAALFVSSDDDVLEALVREGPRIVGQGEMHWLLSLGVPYAFHSRQDM